MKSRIKAPKSMVASLEQEVYAATVEACEDNNAFFLLALNQEFGFGAERLRRVIHRYNELSEEYTVMREDGFTYEEIHDRMCGALESIGIDPDQVYVGKNDFYDMQRRKRQVEKERLPSVKEARQASNHLEAFRAFMAAEGKDIAGKSIMKDFVKGDILNEVCIKR